MEVRMIGAGGIGYHLWEGIIRILMSLDEQSAFVIVDGDEVELTNLSRQFFPDAIGRNKAEVIAEMARTRFDLADKIVVEACPQFLNNETLTMHRKTWIENGYLFLGCVDNNQTRIMVEKEVSKLRDMVYVDGGNTDTTGQAMAYMKRKNRTVLPKITAISPEILADRDKTLPGEHGCLESGPQTALVNRTVATAMEIMVNHLLIRKKPKMNEIRIDTKRGGMYPRLSKPIRRKNGTHKADHNRKGTGQRHGEVRAGDHRTRGERSPHRETAEASAS